MDAPPIDFPRPQIDNDPVVRYLVSIHLIDRERMFRAALATLAAPDLPRVRDVAIATVVTLLGSGGADQWVMTTVSQALAPRTDAELQEDAVAILNGSTLVVPHHKLGIVYINMATMKQMDQPPPAFVSTIYTLATIWETAAAHVGG